MLKDTSARTLGAGSFVISRKTDVAKFRKIHIEYPHGGLDRSSAYRQQPPFTSDSLQNVRSYSTQEGRRRGGSRPGLVLSHRTYLGGAVRATHNMQLTLNDGFTNWSDNFDGSSMGYAWTQARWAASQPQILPSALASIDNSVDDAASVRDALTTLDTSRAYAVEAFLVPWDGAWHGSYSLYMRMDNTTPDFDADGVEVKLTMTGASGNIAAELNSYVSSAKTVVDSDTIAFTGASPGWLTVTVSGTTVTVYFQGTQILNGAVGAHSGTRVGFGMSCTVDGGLCLVNTFRVQYYSTNTLPNSRTLLVAIANGNLWYEQFYGVMVQLTTNLSLRTDVRLSTAQGGQLLYIGDYGLAVDGTDGTVSGTTLDAASVADWTSVGANAYDYVAVLDSVTGSTTAGVYAISSIAAGSVTLASAPGDGTCSFRIERMIKVYDHVNGTLTLLEASAGQIPTGNHLLTRYLDCLFIGGGDLAPNAWFASRQGDYTDWNYAATDSQRAIYGPTSEQGLPGTPLTAQAATSDDYMILFSATETWRMRGHPAAGGAMDNLSETVGCVDSYAWCHGPAGELVFLSRDGVYVIAAGGTSYPIPLSRNILPRELRNIDVSTLEVSLEYDIQGRGIHIFLSPEDSNDRIHWWLDWDTKTFWPVTLQADHEPTAVCQVQSTAVEASGVIMGCSDGYLRTFSDLAHDDCGTAFSAYVVLGPMALNSDGYVGNIVTIDAVMGSESGDVTWELIAANTFEGVSSAAAAMTGTFVAGLNYTVRPSVRGQAFALRLSSTAYKPMTVENIIALIKKAGMRRVL